MAFDLGQKGGNLRDVWSDIQLKGLQDYVPLPHESHKFEAFFEKISELLDLENAVARIPSGRMSGRQGAISMKGQQAAIVRGLLESFFENPKWAFAGLKEMQQAFDEIPAVLKKVRLTGGEVTTPATIYRNAQVRLQRISQEDYALQADEPDSVEVSIKDTLALVGG